MMLKTNVHAHFSRCFFEDDLLLSPITIQMEGCKLEKLEVKDHKPT
jgi:hypothetical protein